MVKKIQMKEIILITINSFINPGVENVESNIGTVVNATGPANLVGVYAIFNFLANCPLGD